MSYAYGTAEWEQAYTDVLNQRTAQEQPPYMLAAPEWVAALERNVQQDAAYKEAGKTWEGSITIHILAKPAIGIDTDIFLLMDLWHGDCRSMRLVPAKAGKAGDFVITGDYDKWKAVITGELDTVKGMMQGKLKLTGDMPTVVRQVAAAKRMVELVGMVDTRYPDEMVGEELDAFRELFKALRDELGT